MRWKRFVWVLWVRMELIRRTGCYAFIRTVQRYSVASWISLKTSWSMHQADSWTSPSLPHVATQTSELEPSAPISCAICWWVNSRPLQLNGHVGVFCRVIERIVDCCIQETDGICRHSDHCGRGWDWTQHRISPETSASGSGFRACLLTCGGSNDDHEPVWGTGLDVMSYI